MNLTSLYTAFTFGLLHTFEPGHGKAFIASNLIGNKSSVSRLVTLFASMFVAHFLLLVVAAGILEFGLSADAQLEVTQFAQQFFPIGIIVLGLYMLFFYYKNERKLKQPLHDCSCGFTPKEITHQKAGIIGFLTGLLPCPTALMTLALAGAEGNFTNSFSYIGIYCLGMVTAMLLIAVTFTKAQDKFAHLFDKLFQKIHPQLFAAVITIFIGVVYMGINLFSHQH